MGNCVLGKVSENLGGRWHPEGAFGDEVKITPEIYLQLMDISYHIQDFFYSMCACTRVTMYIEVRGQHLSGDSILVIRPE